LIVTDEPGTARDWTLWLQKEGFLTITCPGPHQRQCPKSERLPCLIREIVDVAVVDVPTDQVPGPELACVNVHDDGSSVFVHRGGVGHQARPVSISGPATRQALAGAAGCALLLAKRHPAPLEWTPLPEPGRDRRHLTGSNLALPAGHLGWRRGEGSLQGGARGCA
jgi:hypothetical protein